MLEGQELAGKIGELGSYSLDVDSQGFVEIKIGGGDVALNGFNGGAYFKCDIIVLLEKLALKTENAWDNGAIASIKAALGR